MSTGAPYPVPPCECFESYVCPKHRMSTDTTPLTLQDRAIEYATKAGYGKDEAAFHRCFYAYCAGFSDALAATPKAPDPEQLLLAAYSALLYAVSSAQTATRDGATINDKQEAGEAYEAAEKAIAALAQRPAEPAPDQLHALTMAITELANLAYQDGREELYPWPERWQMLQDRIIGLAKWLAAPAARSVEEPKSQPALDHQAQAVAQSPEAVDERRLRTTDDASVWAEEFAKVRPDVDRGLMIGWFANCAENAKDLRRWASEKHQRAVADAFGLDENGRLSTAPEAVAKRAELMAKKAEGL